MLYGFALHILLNLNELFFLPTFLVPLNSFFWVWDVYSSFFLWGRRQNFIDYNSFFWWKTFWQLHNSLPTTAACSSLVVNNLNASRKCNSMCGDPVHFEDNCIVLQQSSPSSRPRGIYNPLLQFFLKHLLVKALSEGFKYQLTSTLGGGCITRGAAPPAWFQALDRHWTISPPASMKHNWSSYF